MKMIINEEYMKSDGEIKLNMRNKVMRWWSQNVKKLLSVWRIIGDVEHVIESMEHVGDVKEEL